MNWSSQRRVAELLLLGSVALAAMIGCANAPARHPALSMVARFEPVEQSPQLVQPYFANLYAVSLCRHGRHLRRGGAR